MKIKVSITVEERVTSYEVRQVAGSTLEVEHVADEFKARGVMAGITDVLEDVSERVEAQLRSVQKSRDALAVPVETESF